MLRIQRSTEGECVVFTLSGRIQGEDAAEVQRLFELEAKEQSITLDLHEVKLVDREAVRFLARCEAAGITLVHCPAYIREWIEREKAQP
jgi:anti-anti-sigma regulatory factor